MAPPRARRPNPSDGHPARRSNAAAPVAVAVLVVGVVLGRWTLLLPLLLGISLLVTTGTFLSARVNPFSIGFYLEVKPSWTAIGVVFLSSLALFAVTYEYFVHGMAPVIPGAFRLGIP